MDRRGRYPAGIANGRGSGSENAIISFIFGLFNGLNSGHSLDNQQEKAMGVANSVWGIFIPSRDYRVILGGADIKLVFEFIQVLKYMDSEQREKIKKIAAEYKLTLIILFGSFAKGKTHAYSDMDIAVKAKENINLKTELEIIRKLTEVFNKKIDLSVINRANPLLLGQINKNAVLLYGNEREFMKFRLYAFHRYNDYLPFFKMEADFVKKQVRQMIKK